MNMTPAYKKELREVRSRRKKLVRTFDRIPGQTDKAVEAIERKARRDLAKLEREIRKLERRELILEGRLSK